MIKLFFLIALLISVGVTSAQKLQVEQSIVTFFSSSPLEDITARNKKATAIFDLTSSQIAFSVPIIDFTFEKKLMQVHFNEKYMETDKYPRATFSGSVNGMDKSMKGEQNVTANGKLTIHGVTHEVEIPGTIEITADKKYLIKSAFKVKLKDYDITIPQLLWQNLAEEIEVNLEFTLIAKAK